MTEREPCRAEPEHLAAEPRGLPSARVLDSAELLRGEKEVQISHAGEVYRLRLTRNGKLILQK